MAIFSKKFVLLFSSKTLILGWGIRSLGDLSSQRLSDLVYRAVLWGSISMFRPWAFRSWIPEFNNSLMSLASCSFWISKFDGVSDMGDFKEVDDRTLLWWPLCVHFYFKPAAITFFMKTSFISYFNLSWYWSFRFWILYFYCYLSLKNRIIFLAYILALT